VDSDRRAAGLSAAWAVDYGSVVLEVFFLLYAGATGDDSLRDRDTVATLLLAAISDPHAKPRIATELARVTLDFRPPDLHIQAQFTQGAPHVIIFIYQKQSITIFY
jgi:hypothetical protein